MRLDFQAPAPDSPRSRDDWTLNIAYAAQREIVSTDQMMTDRPVKIHACFRMPRPKNIKEGMDHQTKPDLLDLQRALIAGLRNIVFRRDAQICSIEVNKMYQEEGLVPCVYVSVGGP